MHPYQNFAVAGRRLRNLRELQHIWGTIAVANDGAHARYGNYPPPGSGSTLWHRSMMTLPWLMAAEYRDPRWGTAETVEEQGGAVRPGS